MELLWILTVLVCAGVLWQIHYFKREVRVSAENMDYRKEPLLIETAAAVEDFLDAGKIISLLSGGSYMGTMAVRLHHRGRGRFGYSVYMYDSGDLWHAYREYQESHRELFQREPESFAELEKFLTAYADGYDRERNALVYVSKHTLILRGNQKQQLEEALFQRISLHPLAEMASVSQIHTKNLG